MDFLRFYGLRKDPFQLTPDPAFFYPSACHYEGLLLMDYSIEQKEGFLLVTGQPGTGKTTLLNVFLEHWRDRAETAIILTPRLSPEEFLTAVAEDLDINIGKKSKHNIIKALRDFMVAKSSEGKRVIIIVDEAQNLPDETLEELRLLSNLETENEKLLQIILSGQPELEARLRTDNLRQLNQRISSRVYLREFNREETLDYINHRLVMAGRKNLRAVQRRARTGYKITKSISALINNNTKKWRVHKKTGKAAHELTKGIPRLVNMLISRALMAAYLEKSYYLLPRHIEHALKSLNHSDMKPRKWGFLRPAFIRTALVVGMLYIFL
ncbi:MAG: DUF2075 domain-containing protein [Nitrospiraceae bacterium]|nr:MAG: DUF2075 domain-containing protein [Nitrospiraceae bacterium]